MNKLQQWLTLNLFDKQMTKHLEEQHEYRYRNCPNLGCFFLARIEKSFNADETVGGVILLGIDEVTETTDDIGKLVLDSLHDQNHVVYKVRFWQRGKTGWLLMHVSEEVLSDFTLQDIASSHVEGFLLSEIEQQKLKANGRSRDE